MELPFNKIIQGDCIQKLNGLPAESIDLAFADPPFNIGYDYDVYNDKLERSNYLAWSKDWISAVYRTLKPNGSFWLAIGDEYAAELKVACQDVGFHARSWVIWYYTFGVNCAKKFSRSHAHLFYFVKDPENFVFRGDAPENRIPSARQLVYADNRANPKGRLPDDTWILRPQDLQDCFMADEDTWYFPRVAGTFKERAGFHGCQMPEQLLGRIIRLCSEEEAVVLDPFAGSATTLAVAKKLGRKYLGFELSRDYVTRGTARLQKAHRGDLLDGSPEPLVSAPSTTKNKVTKAADKAPGKKEKSVGILTPSEKQLSEAAQRATEAGLVEALKRISDGYSIDRVIADPDLDNALADECRKLGLFGDLRSWNHTLLGLRKAGKLADVPATKRTELSWKDYDPYLFASEIALRRMLDQGCESIDEILCDPELAAQFDGYATSLAPNFTPLHFRLGALKLRKSARKARMRAKELKSLRLELQPKLSMEESSRKLPNRPGIYLIQGDGETKNVYAGEALDLQERLSAQVRTLKVMKQWNLWSQDLTVRAITKDEDSELLLAYQSALVRSFDPLLNVRLLAAV